MAESKRPLQARGGPERTHPTIAELADGGRIEVTDRLLVPMGDEEAARQVTYTHAGDTERPACAIVFEIRQGVPVCVSVHLSATNEVAVRPKDLRAIELENLRRDIYGYVGVYRRDLNGNVYRVIRPGGFHADSKPADKAIQGRRRLTPEFLNRVAEIRTSAPAGTRLAAVMAAFDKGEPQALRYIRQARDKGLIDDE